MQALPLSVNKDVCTLFWMPNLKSESWILNWLPKKRSRSTQEVEINAEKDNANEAFSCENNLVTYLPEVPENSAVQDHQAENESEEAELGDILSAFPVR